MAPLSTGKTATVIQLASSDAENSMAPTISLGCPCARGDAGAGNLLPIPLGAAGGPSQPSNEGAPPMVFEMLEVSREGAVLYAKIAAPPMNLGGATWSAISAR